MCIKASLFPFKKIKIKIILIKDCQPIWTCSYFSSWEIEKGRG